MTEGSREARELLQWIAGVLVTVVLAGGGFWLNYVAAQVDDLRADQKTEAKDNAAVRERLRGVEIKVEGIDTTTKQTADDVRRIRDTVETNLRSFGLSVIPQAQPPRDR